MKAGNFSGLALALGAVGLLSGLAWADLSQVELDLNQSSQAFIEFRGGDDRAEGGRELGLDLNSDDGVLFDWSESELTRASLRGQSAHVETSSSFASDAQSAMFSMSLNNHVSLISDTGNSSQGEHQSQFSMQTSFDRDTLVEVLLRIEYQAIGFGDLMARLEVHGLRGAGPMDIVIQNPDIDGVMELTLQGTAAQNRDIWIEGLLESALFIDGGRDPDSSSHVLSIDASIRAAPAPGGALMLGGLGLLASRRRR